MKYRYKYGTPFSGANAEVEGGEMIETPQGQVSEVEGASHEAGGVDTELQKGTKVYSDRIKIGEHTIADRKKYRTERIKKLLEKLGDKTDGLSRNTMKRNLAFFKLQEEHDLTVQNAAKEMLQPQGQTQQLAYGTSDWPDGEPEEMPDGSMFAFPRLPYELSRRAMLDKTNPNRWQAKNVLNSSPVPPQNQNVNYDYSSGYNNPNSNLSFMPTDLEGNPTFKDTGNVSDIPRISPRSINPTVTSAGVLGPPSPYNNRLKPREQNFSSPESERGGIGFTTGDWIGLAGMAIGAGTQMANTIQNAKATKKAVNYWEGFNTNALGANQEAIDEVGYQKDIAVRGTNRMIDINTNNARQRVRGSARGIGTLRALDLGVDATANEAQIAANNNLEATFGGQKQNLINNKIGLLTQRDQMERMGQDKIDEINQANLDNFYTNFGQNLADMSENIQQVGGMVNQSKMNKEFLSTLKLTNRWGIGIEKDEEGNFIFKQ